MTMKTIFTLIFIIISTLSFGQDFSFGIKGGYTNTYISNPAFYSSTEFNHRNGFIAGGLINYSLNKNFSVQGEVLYSQKGYYHTGVGLVPNPSGNYLYNYNYIDVPVLFKMKFGDVVNPFLMTGIAPSFNVSVKQGFKDNLFTNDYVNKFDLGFVISAGADINITDKLAIILEGRATLGLLKVYDASYDYKNIALSLMSGIKF
jgi:opacity protein-like surface antigen